MKLDSINNSKTPGKKAKIVCFFDVLFANYSLLVPNDLQISCFSSWPTDKRGIFNTSLFIKATHYGDCRSMHDSISI